MISVRQWHCCLHCWLSTIGLQTHSVKQSTSKLLDCIVTIVGVVTVLNVVVAMIIEQFNEAVTREKVDEIDPMLLTGIEELDAQGDGGGVRLAVSRRGRRN